MEKNIEVNVLDELNKGAWMGMDAIDYIIDKVNNKDLKKELDREYNKYKKIVEEISKLYPEYSNKEPHETSKMNKVMTLYGIELRTMMDDSTSKLAELLMQGINMGIIEGRRLLNHKSNDENIDRLVKEYVDMQENSIENLKKFL